jgi:MFS family permease
MSRYDICTSAKGIEGRQCQAVNEDEFKKAARRGQLLEISIGITAGVLGLILSPWLANLLTHVEGWAGPKVNLYWLLLVLGTQTIYWLWRLCKLLIAK